MSAASGTTAAGAAILDTGDGVARLMGERALYGRLLARFRSDHGAAAARIGAALAAGQYGPAQHLLHNLKGAAGMIGAQRLALVASQLERAGAGGRELALLGEALAGALDAIDVALAGDFAGSPTGAPAPQPLHGDPAGLARLVDLLANLLANADGAALDLLDESGASLKSVLGDARFHAIAAAAREFDFDGALAVLARPAGAGAKRLQDS